MKKKLIGFSVAGALLLGSAGVYASTNSKTLEVFYNIKNIKIDQVSKMPEEKPFTYNGTTYVPLRYISEELGYPVEWDSPNQTIHIGKTSEKSAFYPGRDLEYMNFQNSDGYKDYYSYSYNKNTISDNIGNEYNNYITISTGKYGDWSLIEFPLNGQYNTFKTTLGLTEKSKNLSGEAKLEVYIDEKISETYTFTGGNMPKNIELKLKGANKIGFKVSKKDSTSENVEIGLFDARFYK